MIQALSATDIPQFISLMQAFAEFDGSTDEFELTTEDIRKNWLGANPKIHTLLKYDGEKAIGMLNYFYTFSSFQGKSCIWVEDVFILDSYRGKGYGVELFHAVREIAKQQSCPRVEWLVRKNNDAGRRFYDRLGAKVDEGTIYVKWKVE